MYKDRLSKWEKWKLSKIRKLSKPYFFVQYMTMKIFHLLIGVLFISEPKIMITHKLSAEGNKELSLNKHPCSQNCDSCDWH